MSSHHPIIIPEINDKHAICDYLSQTASILAQKSYPTYIFYINETPRIGHNLKKISSHLFSFSPFKIIPFNRFKTAQNINIHLSLNLLYLLCFLRYFSRPVYWLFYPQTSSLIKHSLPSYLSIYDIVDFYTSPNPKINQKLQIQKKYFLEKSNLITAISATLVTNYQKIYPSVKIHLVPQGFSLITSSFNKNNQQQLLKIKKISPKIGFIGAINNRLDFNLLFKLIKITPKINYIFIGPIDNDINVSSKPIKKLAQKLFSFPNVIYLGSLPKNKLSQYLDLFDIAIIPYDIKDNFNRFCYPMKLFEYFAAGKPVISTSIEELKHFPGLVFISNNPLFWQQKINEILSQPWPKNLQKKQQALARQNSWINKINQILALAQKIKVL